MAKKKKHRISLSRRHISIALISLGVVTVSATTLAVIRHKIQSRPSVALAAITKTAGCVSVNALPDSACTPGAKFSGATKGQVCIPGYGQLVRNVPQAIRDQVFKEYGIDPSQSSHYEVDHLVSIELGGSNDVANLWPEPADPTPGFHEKDKVENALHKEVCDGKISLEQAQQEISNNWLAVYSKLVVQ